MRTGNRSFPYPVLNANQELSAYRPNCVFRQHFDVNEEGSPILEGGDLVLRNAQFVLLDTYLASLTVRGILEGVFIVDSPAGCYRRAYKVTMSPRDIRIPIARLKGTVTVSCFLYATQDIEHFAPTQLLSLYDGLTFHIDKFDILAADDGVDFTIDIDESHDNRTASIFTIIKKDVLDGLIKYESRPRSIVIQLPEDQYACYDNMKRHSAYNDISFALIAIPVLAGCLSSIKSEVLVNGEEDLLEALDRWNWLNSVLLSYKRATEKELDLESFMSIPAYELAQIVLDGACCKGLSVFNDILVGGLKDLDGEGGIEDGND